MFRETSHQSENITEISCFLLSCLAVRFSKGFVRSFLIADKHYPSLSSISNLLNSFQIENRGIRTTAENLKELPYPFVALIQDDGVGNFVVINTPVVGSEIKYVGNGGFPKVVSISEFERKWDGILLLTGKHSNAYSKENDDYVRSERRDLLYTAIKIAASFALFFSLLQLNVSETQAKLLFVKSTGLLCSLILLKQDLGFKSKLFEAFCKLGIDQKKIGCDKVSDSNAAWFMGVVRMSELGTLYFLGGLIYVFMVIINSDSEPFRTLYLLSIFAVPFIFLSLYDQLWSIKQICPFCLAIIICLITETILLRKVGVCNLFDMPTNKDISRVLLSFVIPIVFWLSVRTQLFRQKDFRYSKDKLSYFLKSPGALNGILSEALDQTLTPLQTISINPKNKFQCSVVLSLFCKPCEVAFREVAKISAKYPNVRFDIILIPDESSNQIISKVLETKFFISDDAAIKELAKWYEDKIFDGSQPSQSLNPEIQETLDIWKTWIDNNNIKITPSIFINKRLKPHALSINDFEHIFAQA